MEWREIPASDGDRATCDALMSGSWRKDESECEVARDRSRGTLRAASIPERLGEVAKRLNVEDVARSL